MAEKLTEFPAEASSRTGYTRYNWTEFFDGDPRMLTPGEDFTVDIKSFRSAAGQAAKVRVDRGDLRGALRMAVVKRKVTVPAEEEGAEPTEEMREFVAMQFVKEEEKPEAPTEDAPAIPAQTTPATAAENTEKPAETKPTRTRTVKK